MIPLTAEEKSIMTVKRNVIYVKNGLFVIKKKIHTKIIKKLEIIVISQGNLERLLIAFVI